MKFHFIYKCLFSVLLFINFETSYSQTSDTTYLSKRIDSVYLLKNDSNFAFSTTYDVLKISNEINFKSGIASSSQLLGYLFYEYGDFDKAKKYLYEAYDLNKIIKNDRLMAQNLRLIGIYLEGKNEYIKALEVLMQSLSLRQKISDQKGIAECFISIGIIYQRSGQLQTAISYYKKALAYFIKTKNEKVIGAINSNIGTAYNEQGKLDSALFFLKKVIISKQKLNDHIGLAKAYHNIATTYSYLGKFEQSLSYYNMALKSSGGGENNSNNGITYEAAGAVLIKMNRLVEAEKYLLTCKRIYLKNGMSTQLVACYDKLMTLYEKKSDFKKSVNYIKLMNQLGDSIRQNTDESSLAAIEAKYKAIEKTHENELLKAKNYLLEQDSRQKKILAISLSIVLIISAFLAFNLREVKRTKNKLLHQNEIIESKNTNAVIQNEKLEKLIDENQTLMGVLAHDLRSPFNKIIGLTNLLQNDLDATVDEKIVYFNFINSICKDSVQLIQDTINLSEIFHLKNSDTIIKKENISSKEIQSEMVKSFKAIALEKGTEIVINSDQEDINIHSSKEYLNRILDNLLSNAIKFSPPNSIIEFSVKNLQNKAIFSIKDQGPGFTDSDKQQIFMRFKKLSARPTGNEASSGLGLYIVKQLTEIVGGNISVNSEVGKGAEFIIEIPLAVA